MIQIDSPKIDSNLLNQEIENIIENYNKTPLKKIVKRGKRVNKKRDIYQVADFTRYHDVEFIKNIYKKILLREVDQEGLDIKLKLLREGKRSKTEILSMVRFSKEGRDKNVPILGIKKRFIMSALYRIPILSFFVKILRFPTFVEQLNRLESNHFLYQKEQNSKIELQNRRVENKIEDNRAETISNLKELEHRITEIRRAKEQLKEMENSLSTLVNSIKSGNNHNILESLEKEQKASLDELYISFEDKFRGTREDIKSRQAYYLPIVKDIIKESDKLSLDIGCGRGEWLELLSENSIKAKGVDLNRLMVKESIDLGLDVINKDAISYLKSLENGSLSVITGFHIVEHLPFETLISLFDEAYRVLRDGGAVIFETPNPENIIVGSCNFYTDPTHINPIPPITLQFLAQNRGFRDVVIHRLHPMKKPHFTDNNQDINSLIFASTKEQDYSIIGYK